MTYGTCNFLDNHQWSGTSEAKPDCFSGSSPSNPEGVIADFISDREKIKNARILCDGSWSALNDNCSEPGLTFNNNPGSKLVKLVGEDKDLKAKNVRLMDEGLSLTNRETVCLAAGACTGTVTNKIESKYWYEPNEGLPTSGPGVLNENKRFQVGGLWDGMDCLSAYVGTVAYETRDVLGLTAACVASKKTKSNGKPLVNDGVGMHHPFDQTKWRSSHPTCEQAYDAQKTDLNAARTWCQSAQAQGVCEWIENDAALSLPMDKFSDMTIEAAHEVAVARANTKCAFDWNGCTLHSTTDETPKVCGYTRGLGDVMLNNSHQIANLLSNTLSEGTDDYQDDKIDSGNIQQILTWVALGVVFLLGLLAFLHLKNVI